MQNLTQTMRTTSPISRTMRWALAGGALVLLAACAQPTPYKPRLDTSTGFAEQQLGANRFRVTFAGNQVTGREIVENYLLYRAAELTLQKDGDHFVMADKEIERVTDYYQQYDPWPGSYGLYGMRRYGGFGYGMGYNTSTYAQSSYRGYADILIFKGPTPKNDPKSFDAREIIKNLGPYVQRPQQAG